MSATRSPKVVSASSLPAGASASPSGAPVGANGVLPSRSPAAPDSNAAAASFGAPAIIGSVAGGVAIGVGIAALTVFVVLRRRAAPKRNIMKVSAQEVPSTFLGQALPATPAPAPSGSQRGGSARTVFAPLPPAADRADAAVDVHNPYARSLASV